MKTYKPISANLPLIVLYFTLLLACSPVFFLSRGAYAQNSEFETHANGLIYSAQTVQQLKAIVDSLNLKHKVCDLHKQYRALAQARGHFISLTKGNFNQARQDMEAQMPLEAFLKKYPSAKIEKDLLVTRTLQKNWKDALVVEFFSLPLNDKGQHEMEFPATSGLYQARLKNRWVFDRYSMNATGIEAFYFAEEFKALPLPTKYARLVQYADCMIDTTTQIMLEGNDTPDFSLRATPAAIQDFISYVHQKTGKPTLTENASDDDYDQYWKWNTVTRPEKVKHHLSQEKEFKVKLAFAYATALSEGGYEEELEEYVEDYLSKPAALELKRRRRVIGGCSQDTRPREHAVAIAKLSAETVHWPTFLRAHLDVMNDRFERMSDGSYAWAGRKTYIKELEVLDINVLDLMLGISLRVENAGDNHYYGSIG